MQAPLAYADLSPDLVVRAVESTGRVSDLRVLALNSYENRVYQVGLDEDLPVIAKFYRPGRWSDAQLREEHAFARELAEAELPIVAPLADAAGETLFAFEGHRFALFPRKGGQAPEPGDLDQLHRLGMLLGRMHAVARQAPFAHRPALTVQRFLDEPAQAVLAAGVLPEDLKPRYRAVVAALREAVLAAGVERAPRIRTQGDCHPGNILWTRDDGPWLVDFDDCQDAPPAQDLWMLLAGHRHEQELQLAELLDGYETFCPFENTGIALVEPLRALRMAHYAGWLTLRREDPAFLHAFSWFGDDAYWRGHVAELEEQLVLLREPPLRRL